MTEIQPAYSADQLRQLLVAGAAFNCGPPEQAAVHLLTFTELPARHRFAELVEVSTYEHWDDGTPIQGAWVRDWPALPDSPAAAHLPGGHQRLLALADSLASNQPVNLRDNVGVDGHAHARRVIEAFAIATGHAEMFTITPTAKLDQMPATGKVAPVIEQREQP
jgi:hypothetical protein